MNRELSPLMKRQWGGMHSDQHNTEGSVSSPGRYLEGGEGRGHKPDPDGKHEYQR